MDEQKVKEIISKMTLKEKILFLGCGLSLKTNHNNRFKIPSVSLNRELMYGRQALAGLGCTFDSELIRDYAAIEKERLSSGECRHDSLLNLGVIREPMSEGSQYMFSEDPLIVTELAKSYIDGAERVIGTNIVSGENDFCDRFMDERAKNELYFKPFLSVAKSLSGVVVPCGSLNGDILAQSKEFIENIKKLLADKSFILSMPGAFMDKIAAIKSGACYEVGASAKDIALITKAVKMGQLDESEIDECIGATIKYLTKSEMLSQHNLELTAANKETVEKRLAYESIVLLQNDGILPLMYSDAKAGIDCSGIDDTFETIEREMNSQITCVNADVSDEYDVLVIFAAANGTELSKKAYEAITKAKKIGKKSILCIMSSIPIELNMAVKPNAIFYIPHFCIETFDNIADMICGIKSPCGKLNVSWAYKESDYPANRNARAKKRGMFCYESILNGHTYFSQYGAPIMFPFGHGLTYANFAYSKLNCNLIGDKVDLSFSIKNQSENEAANVLFIFAECLSPETLHVNSRLIGFKRLQFDRGEGKIIQMQFNVGDVVCVHHQTGHTTNGKYAIKICSSANETIISNTFKYGKSNKNERINNQKNIPSYFVQSNFNPTGVDIEKVMGMPLIVSGNKNADYFALPTINEMAKIEMLVGKKLKKVFKKEEVALELNGLTLNACNKIIDSMI